MPAFSAGDLIDRAASAADMHDLFISPKEWYAWLNVERQALCISAARSGWVLNGIQFFTVNPSTDLVAGAYTVPSEFLAVIGVWEVDGAGRARRIEISNFPDSFHQTGVTITGAADKVWVEDAFGEATNSTLFHFWPVPTANTYRIAVVKVPIEQQDGVIALMNYPMGVEERIVLGMARRALMKEESDTTDIDLAISREDQRVEEMSWSRAFAESPTVRNVDQVSRGWNKELVFGSPNNWLWV